MPGLAAGAVVGQADPAAGPPEGHALPVIVAVPVASRILAAVVVVTNAIAATATLTTVTPSTRRRRPRRRTA
jgi:hypothetical protein